MLLPAVQASTAAPAPQALLEKLDTLAKLQPGQRQSSPTATATAQQQQRSAEEAASAAAPAEAAVSRVLSSEAASEQPSVQPSVLAAEATVAAAGGEPSVLSDTAFAAAASRGPSVDSEHVELQLEEGEDGEVRFKLTLSPSKAAPDAEAAEDAADPGHVERQESAGPAADAAAAVSPALPPPPPRRRTEEMPARPGALTNQAAKGVGVACVWLGGIVGAER